MKTTYPLIDFKTAKDWHIYYVYNDLEFQKDMEVAEKEIDINKKTKKHNRIKSLFKITTKDINLYKMNQHIYLKNVNKTTKLKLNKNLTKFSIEFTRETTR